MYPVILNDREETLKLIVEKLGRAPTDFSTQFEMIRKKRREHHPWQAAGVLLILRHKADPGMIAVDEGTFVFQLIKRSASVPQGGDLSCPGGILEPPVDRLFSGLIEKGFPPMIAGEAMTYASERGEDELKTMTLFLANATRETWEEIGLNPFDVTFLGPLPCYSLTLFTKTIFPLVGLMNGKTAASINGEVEKIIEIPLKAFFEKEQYALYSIEASTDWGETREGLWDFPCLVYCDADGQEEILWGATFGIILSFLKIVFDFELPDLAGARVISRSLDLNYLSGNTD